MLYWLSVYMLVVIGVALPFVLLYLVGVFFSLAFCAVRFVMRSLKNILTGRPEFAHAQCNIIRRKEA